MANMIITSTNPEEQQLHYGYSLIACDAIMSYIHDIPSAIEFIDCSSDSLLCKTKSDKSVMYLTYQIGKEGHLKDLQTFLNESKKNVYVKCSKQGCNGFKATKTKILTLHLFIDVLYWEGKYIKLCNYFYYYYLLIFTDILNF